MYLKAYLMLNIYSMITVMVVTLSHKLFNTLVYKVDLFSMQAEDLHMHTHTSTHTHIRCTHIYTLMHMHVHTCPCTCTVYLVSTRKYQESFWPKRGLP